MTGNQPNLQNQNPNQNQTQSNLTDEQMLQITAQVFASTKADAYEHAAFRQCLQRFHAALFPPTPEPAAEPVTEQPAQS